MKTKMVIFKDKEIQVDAIYRPQCELGRNSVTEDEGNQFHITTGVNNGTKP